MNLTNILVLIFFMGITERIIFTFFGQKEKEGTVKYRWTTNLLMSTYIFCLVFILLEFKYSNKQLNIIITSLGACIEMMGVYLRRASNQSLNGFWSAHIKSITGQSLVKSGPYALVRHPYYLAVILELIGWALFLNSFLAIGVIFLIHFPLLLLRISCEEKQLLDLFGDEYQKYSMNVNQLVPKFNYWRSK